MIELLQGSLQVNDENEDIIETYVGLQTEGSKTLTVKSNSIVVWLPSICCWDSSECALAPMGKFRRAPGIVIGRDSKRLRMWWDRIPRGRGGVGIGFGKSVASSQGLQGGRREGIISSTRRGLTSYRLDTEF
jgi:hypothetical protein